MSGEIWGFASAIALILVGILLNQTGLHRVNDRLDRIQSGLGARLDRMQTDLSQFYRNLGQHDARLDNIEKRTQ